MHFLSSSVAVFDDGRQRYIVFYDFLLYENHFRCRDVISYPFATTVFLLFQICPTLELLWI